MSVGGGGIEILCVVYLIRILSLIIDARWNSPYTLSCARSIARFPPEKFSSRRSLWDASFFEIFVRILMWYIWTRREKRTQWIWWIEIYYSFGFARWVGGAQVRICNFSLNLQHFLNSETIILWCVWKWKVIEKTDIKSIWKIDHFHQLVIVRVISGGRSNVTENRLILKEKPYHLAQWWVIVSRKICVIPSKIVNPSEVQKLAMHVKLRVMWRMNQKECNPWGFWGSLSC